MELTLEELYQYMDRELKQMRQSAVNTTINILGIRMALVDKGVVTEEELERYDEIAGKSIKDLMIKQKEQMEAIIKEKHGEEAAAKLKKEFEDLLN